MHQKGFAPILIVILIAVLAGGYLIYQNYQNQPKPTPIPTPQPTSTPTPTPESTNSAETTNWKTYTNNQYRFSLKYPAKWFTGISNDGTILFDKNLINGVAVVEPDQVAITIEIITDLKLIDLYINNPTGDVENRVINSIPFDYITIKTEGGQPPKQIIFAQTQHGTKLYRLGLSNRFSKDIFDQILSTFKFLP